MLYELCGVTLVRVSDPVATPELQRQDNTEGTVIPPKAIDPGRRSRHSPLRPRSRASASRFLRQPKQWRWLLAPRHP